eukprot:5365195-Pleurochrysis_carterae.AAC.1
MACAHVGLSLLCVVSPIAMLASVSPSLHIVKMPVNSSLNQSSSPTPPRHRNTAAGGSNDTSASTRAAFISAGYDCAARVR